MRERIAPWKRLSVKYFSSSEKCSTLHKMLQFLNSKILYIPFWNWHLKKMCHRPNSSGHINSINRRFFLNGFWERPGLKGYWDSVPVLSGHDLEGEHELMQRNLKQSGQNLNVIHWLYSRINTLWFLSWDCHSWTFPFLRLNSRSTLLPRGPRF